MRLRLLKTYTSHPIPRARAKLARGGRTVTSQRQNLIALRINASSDEIFLILYLEFDLQYPEQERTHLLRRALSQHLLETHVILLGDHGLAQAHVAGLVDEGF